MHEEKHEHHVYEMLEVAADMIEKGDDNQHLPFMILDDTDGASLPVIFPMPPKDIRHDLMRHLGQQLRQLFNEEHKELKQIWLCSDTYMGKFPANGTVPEGYSAGDDPNATEAIMCARLDNTGFCEIAIRPYEKEVTLDGDNIKWGDITVTNSNDEPNMKPYLLQEIFDGYREGVAV